MNGERTSRKVREVRKEEVGEGAKETIPSQSPNSIPSETLCESTSINASQKACGSQQSMSLTLKYSELLLLAEIYLLITVGP